MTKLGRDDVDVYATGTWGEVVGIHDATGSSPTTAYLTDLPARVRTKFDPVINRLAETGRVSNQERFRQIQHKGAPQVWEIKVHEGPGHRFYCVQRGKSWLITHAGQKPRNNLYSVEVTRCHTAITEWDERA